MVGPFVYVRFHGVNKYSGRYSDRTIDDWAVWLTRQLQDGRPVYAYFNNDMEAQAPRDAIRLRGGLTAHVSRIELPTSAGG